MSAGPTQAESLVDVSVRRYKTLSLNHLPVLLLVEGVFPGVSITGNSSQSNLTPQCYAEPAPRHIVADSADFSSPRQVCNTADAPDST